MQPTCVCVLLYGDYPALATRVLESLQQQSAIQDCSVWVWGNAISDATVRVVSAYREPLRLRVFLSENIGKYPAMRAMLYSPEFLSSTLVWMDDDAYFTDLRGLDGLLSVDTASALVGWMHRMPYRPGQRDWIKRQPWYTGRQRDRFTFAQGSLWRASAARLREHNYPWPELHHNGGDSMLGELAFQQAWATSHYTTYMRVNADMAGKINGSQRRGISEWEIGRDAN